MCIFPNLFGRTADKKFTLSAGLEHHYFILHHQHLGWSERVSLIVIIIIIIMIIIIIIIIPSVFAATVLVFLNKVDSFLLWSPLLLPS